MITKITKVTVAMLLLRGTLVVLRALSVSALALAIRSSTSLSPINLPFVHDNFRNSSLVQINSTGLTPSSMFPIIKYPPLASWPETPFRISIPIATPPQVRYSLYFTSADPVTRSEPAKSATLSACHEMIHWIDTLLPLFESYVLRPHTIIQEFDETGVLKLHLYPSRTEPGLSKRLALRGVETLRALVQRYGEAELRFEFWEGITVRGLGKVDVSFENFEMLSNGRQ